MREIINKLKLDDVNQIEEEIEISKHNYAKDSNLQYDNILKCYERDIGIISDLSKSIGFKIFFAFQPIATWIDKELTKEEFEIFSIFDSMQNDWLVLSKYIKDKRFQYINDVNKICDGMGISFIDLNTYKEFKQKEWYFADRVHLTDKGYDLTAKILKREFQL